MLLFALYIKDGFVRFTEGSLQWDISPFAACKSV